MHEKGTPAHPTAGLPTPIVLSGSLDQYTAEELKEQLLRWLASSANEQPSLLLDMTAVEHIDASALQVLLACRADLARRGTAPSEQLILIKGAEPPIRQWIRIAGASDLFAFQDASV